jgi:hypothetical protein
MTLADRVKFYGFGFVLGILVLSTMLNKKCSNSFGFLNPKKMKMEELTKQSLRFSAIAQCQLRKLKMSESDFKQALSKSSINYDRSDISAKPVGIYIVESKLVDGRLLISKIGDNDSISEVVELSIAGVTFNCK